MKTFVLLPVVGALVLGLAACSKNDDAVNASVGNDTALNSTDFVSEPDAGNDAGLVAANGVDANAADLNAGDAALPADNAATANTL